MTTANNCGLAVWYLAVIGAVVFTVPNLILNASAGALLPWHLASAVMACILGLLTLLITSRES